LSAYKKKKGASIRDLTKKRKIKEKNFSFGISNGEPHRKGAKDVGERRCSADQGGRGDRQSSGTNQGDKKAFS